MELAEIIACSEPGTVRLVRCRRVATVCATIERGLGANTHDCRVLALSWKTLPKMRVILDETISRLAETCYGLWPDWYGQDLLAEEFRPEALRESLAERDRGTRRELLVPWLGDAIHCCCEGRTPQSPDYSNSIQAAQLGLAIEPRRLTLVFCVMQAEPEEGRLFGLARAAEWFAKETGAAVLVAVAEDCPHAEELASIAFDAISLVEEERPRKRIEEEKGRAFLWPLHGRPHPSSAGEQLLAQALSRDTELGPLFAFNQPVTTCRGSHYCVDLLWSEGRVVVEVDGYHWHSDRQAFSHDRGRDYELLISGYVVLRLPHDEVIEDVQLAMEKIRDVVHFRRATVLSEKGAKR